MLSSPLQTSSSTMIDDRSLRTYLRHNSAWNLDENGHMDHYNLSASSNGDKLLNTSVHFPSEMRSANLNQMVSSIVDENSEYQQYGMIPTFAQQQTAWINGEQTDQHMHYVQQMRNIPSRPMKLNSSSFSESGYPRNIPDLRSTHYNPPKDIQVLIRTGDHIGVNSLIKNVSLQQFRQMIGLQRSSGSSSINDRRHHNNYNNFNQQSLPTSNIRLINAFKQQENKRLNQQWSQDTNPNQQQQIYPGQHSSMMSISSHDTIPISSTMNDGSLASPQEISYFRSNRRTGVANTLHIAIEKCYEQLNYIRDSYAETESKIGLQILLKSPSLSSAVDLTNTNFPCLSNNASRVDRLIAEYHYEYNRIIRLHERIKEDLNNQDIEATGQTLDEWLNAINIVQDRRRQEIDNATEKCRTGEAHSPDEKDVLQLAESLRVLRITTRKIRTVLWYWLYWSTNSTTHKIPLIARRQDESKQYSLFDGQNDNLFYASMNHEVFDIPESDGQQMISLKKKSIQSNEHNKENECNE